MLLAGVVDGGRSPLGVVTASTPEEARAVVKRYKEAGFEQIKVYQSLKPELVPIIAAEAHRLGMTVTGHVPTGMNAFQFVAAGADQINHLNFITAVMRPTDFRPQPGRFTPIDLESAEAKRAIQFFKEHGTVIDPSLARGEQHLHPKETPYASFEPGAAKQAIELNGPLNSTGVSPEVAPRAQAIFEQSLAVVGALHRAGVPIVLGTDLVVPGHSIYRELELAVQAGLTPMEAIQAATIVPARAMKRDQESGTVEAGKRADVILVDGNPLVAISQIRHVKFVIISGRMYDCAPLWQSVGFRP
jgi:imidazolonepropionase-like amidohydrolase